MRNKPRNFCFLLVIIITINIQIRSVRAQDIAQPKEDKQSSQEQNIQKAKAHYAAGRQFIQQGNYSAADEEFKKAQQLLGTAPVSVSGKTKQEVFPLKAPAVGETAVSKIEPPRDMISFYLDAIKREPKNADFHYNLALEYIRLSEFKKAENEFKWAMHLDPKDKDACYNLGVLYESYFGDKKQAIYYYTRYIRLARRAEDRRQVKAWIRELKKQLKEQ